MEGHVDSDEGLGGWWEGLDVVEGYLVCGGDEEGEDLVVAKLIGRLWGFDLTFQMCIPEVLVLHRYLTHTKIS